MASTPPPENPPPPAPAEVYLGLRSQVLQGTREKFSLAPSAIPTEPWGAVMDWKIAENFATIVAIENGAASIYLSNGGGYIGGQKHESVRIVAKAVVALAQNSVHAMHSTTECPLPRSGEINFYLLTDAGLMTAAANEVELRSATHPLAKLGGAFQQIINLYMKLPMKPADGK